MGPEKRLPFALFLAFVAILGLQLVMAPKQMSEEDKRAIEEQQAAEFAADTQAADRAPGTDAGEASAQPELEPWDEWVRFGKVGEPGYMAVHFDSYGGSVSEIRLGNHFTRVGLSDEERADRDNWVQLVRPGVESRRVLTTLMTRSGVETSKILAVDPAAVHWRWEMLEGGGVRFVHEDVSGVTLTKAIRPIDSNYELSVELGVSVHDASLVGKRLKFGLVAAVGMQAETNDGAYQEPQAVAALLGGDPKTSAVDTRGKDRRVTLKDAGEEQISYFGCQNKYFAMLMRPADDASASALREASKVAVEDRRWASNPANREDLADRYRDIMVEGTLSMVAPSLGEPVTRTYELYAGPKDASLFEQQGEAFESLLREDLGFFDGIASIILGFLRFLHGIVGNWGWAIILLTMTVRLMLFPLQRKMQTSMARHATKMRRVQPKIDALKEKYEKDPQRLRQEQAKLFQEEGAMPPIGGCLPIFLQIPIFFGLFSALRVAFDLRHQPFMAWIEDLSQPDRLIVFSKEFFFIGDSFNLLPILMVVLWIGQQKVMPKPATMSEQQEQMQKIMMWMPIMFGFFLYNYASGLSLYMITTSLFGIVEATVIRKVWPIDDSEKAKEPKKKGRFRQRLEELQKQAVAMQEEQQRQRSKGQGKGGSKKRR